MGAIARQLAMGVRADYADLLPSALACFGTISRPASRNLRLPVAHHPFARTTNDLERLFVEERRRLKIIPNGFGEKPVLKLMFGALTHGPKAGAHLVKSGSGKFPSLAGWRPAASVIGFSVFWRPAATLQGRWNGIGGGVRLEADVFRQQVGLLAQPRASPIYS
jgi:hypothetical protein